MEKWSEALPELRTLFPEHYDELSLDKDTIELAPNLPVYAEAEAGGKLFLATARSEGKLVGYLIAGIMPHLHYANAGLMAVTDAYFLLPEHRKGGGARFLMFVEDVLRAKGIVKIYISSKLKQNHAQLFSALGYKPTDMVFTKLLGE